MFFPEQCSCSGKRAAKQGLSLSKPITMELWSCHREKAVKGACTVTQAARDSRRLAAVAWGDKARHLHVWWWCLDGEHVAAVNNNLCRQAGGSGACMHGLKNEHKQPINLTLNDGDEVGDGEEGA